MLKISITSDSEPAIQFQLEGKLVGAWVEELRRLTDEAFSLQKAVSLDLEKYGSSMREESPCCAISRRSKCWNSTALSL